MKGNRTPGFKGTPDPNRETRLAVREQDPKFQEQQCTAKSRRTGEQCRQWSVTGSDKCRFHGGSTPKGVAHHSTMKSGKYSKYLEGDLHARYEEAIAREDLTELSHELGIMDARLTQLIEKIGSGETTAMWRELFKTWTEFMMAVRLGDSETQNSLLGTLNRLITQGHSISHQWDEVFSLTEKRRKLVETETKRAAVARDTISVEQAVLMINMVIESTRLATLKHADKKTAQAILTDAQSTYAKLVGPRHNTRPSDAVVDGEYSTR